MDDAVLTLRGRIPFIVEEFMESKHFLVLSLVGTGLAMASAFGAGCGGGSKSSSSAAGAGGASSSSSHSTTVVTSGSGGAGGGASGNHVITGATPIDVNGAPTNATFVDAMTSDFYTFNGTAGERIYIQVLAPELAAENKATDPMVTDPTVVLVGADMNVMMPLTYQAGAWPNLTQDSELFVQLPTTGAYYLSVQDCNALFTSGCPNPVTGITNFEYNLIVDDTSKLSPAETLATASNSATASAAPVTYKATTTANQYYENVVGGDFQSATETDVFSFMPPATAPTGGRARAEFFVQPIGSFQGGDLSDANVKAWITDSTGTTILSEDDQNNYVTSSTTYSLLDLSLPYTPGQQYYLFVQNTQTAGSPAMDFYFVSHYMNLYINVAEAEGPTGIGMNDTPATAQVLLGQGTAKDLFTVDGNISAPGPGPTGDIDYYSFDVPTGTTMYGLQCDSARSGSGLGSFTAELLAADGMTSIKSVTEMATTDISTAPVALPSGTTAGSLMYLKASAATQSATDTGTMYRCYVFFQ